VRIASMMWGCGASGKCLPLNAAHGISDALSRYRAQRDRPGGHGSECRRRSRPVTATAEQICPGVQKPPLEAVMSTKAACIDACDLASHSLNGGDRVALVHEASREGSC